MWVYVCVSVHVLFLENYPLCVSMLKTYSTTNGILMKFPNYSNTHFICMITNIHTAARTQRTKLTRTDFSVWVRVRVYVNVYLLFSPIYARHHCELTRVMLIVVVFVISSTPAPFHFHHILCCVKFQWLIATTCSPM